MKKESLIIANPIYDTVFKRLMEDERAAKFFIGTLIGVVIESVTILPQEFTYEVDPEKFGLSGYRNKLPKGIKMYRLDFNAVIKTRNGELKKVLIEIQKAWNFLDLMRFRNYLGEQYKKVDKTDNGSMALPVITIYILGFTLRELDNACIKVERRYLDMIENKVIDTKSDFIEKLTHNSYIVQTEKITDRYRTRLDKLLSIFEQNYFIGSNKAYKEFKNEIDMEEIKIITDILHHSATDNEERQKIETEQEALRTFDAYFGDVLRQLEIKDRALVESKGVIEEKDKVIDETTKALDETSKALDESKEVIEQKDKVIDETTKALDESKEVIEEKDKVINETFKALDEKDRLIEELKRRLREN